MPDAGMISEFSIEQQFRRDGIFPNIAMDDRFCVAKLEKTSVNVSSANNKLFVKSRRQLKVFDRSKYVSILHL